MQRRYFKVKDVAIFLGLSEASVRRLVDRGIIPSRRMGRSVLIDIRELERKPQDEAR